ncbi:hypothetical protein [Agromyces arachidis]|uniref:hypothetical protein n=1 Tax=Agromyces arachidis TaxID=766966 RepID=UPI004055F950
MRTEPPTGDELTRMLVTMKQRVLDEAAHDPAPARRAARNRAIITSTAILLTLGLGAGAAIAAGMIGEDEEPTAARSEPESAVAPAAAPAPTPTPFGIETAPPVDPLSTVTTITLRPEGLELTDGDGTLVRTLSYEGDGATTAAVLAAVLDEEPEVTDYAPDGDLLARVYTWTGIEVAEHHEPWMHRAGTRLVVTSLLPSIGDGVSVTTASGFSVGDDLAAYAAAHGIPYDMTGQSGQDLVALEYGPALGPDRAGYVDAMAVVANEAGDTPLGAIVWAPFNFAPEDGTN